MERKTALTWTLFAAVLAAPASLRADCPDAASDACGDECECECPPRPAAHRSPPSVWLPPTAGPFVAFTAPLPPEGALTLQPLLFWTRVRGEYGPDSAYEPLPEGDAFSGVTAQLFVEYALPWRTSIGGQATVVRNWASSGARSAAATGLGDTLVFARFAVLEEPTVAPAATLLAQLKIPTARFEAAAPERLGTEIIGTGTWDATFGISLTRAFRPIVSHLDLLLTLPATATVDGVETRQGWRFLWSAAVEIPLYGERAALMVEATGRHDPDLRLDGARAVDSQLNELLVGAGVELIFSDRLQLLFGYQRTLWGTNAGAIDVLGLTLVPTL